MAARTLVSACCHYEDYLSKRKNYQPDSSSELTQFFKEGAFTPMFIKIFSNADSLVVSNITEIDFYGGKSPILVSALWKIFSHEERSRLVVDLLNPAREETLLRIGGDLLSTYVSIGLQTSSELSSALLRNYVELLGRGSETAIKLIYDLVIVSDLIDPIELSEFFIKCTNKTSDMREYAYLVKALLPSAAYSPEIAKIVYDRSLNMKEIEITLHSLPVAARWLSESIVQDYIRLHDLDYSGLTQLRLQLRTLGSEEDFYCKEALGYLALIDIELSKIKK